MTEARKLKKVIRERARKTGERYTAARRQVLLAREKRRTNVAAAPPPSRGRAASISDAAFVRKTGHGLDHWFTVLDGFAAGAKGHTASAGHLHEAHGVPGWHAQMITVAYERARGLRATNQAGSGRFQVSVSKTVAATAAEVARVFGDARRRGQWLRAADPGLRRALEAAMAGPRAHALVLKKDEYARMRFKWDGATVEIRVCGKPKGGSSIVADNSDLPDAGAVERRRSQWKSALNELARYVAT